MALHIPKYPKVHIIVCQLSSGKWRAFLSHCPTIVSTGSDMTSVILNVKSHIDDSLALMAEDFVVELVYFSVADRLMHSASMRNYTYISSLALGIALAVALAVIAFYAAALISPLLALLGVPYVVAAIIQFFLIWRRVKIIMLHVGTK